MRTGDHARVDPEGFVWIEGRTSDLINRGGNKVFPEQVEEVLRLVPGVQDAAVIGWPDDRLGEVPSPWWSATPPTKRWGPICRTELAPYKIPVAFQRGGGAAAQRGGQAACAASCSTSSGPSADASPA